MVLFALRCWRRLLELCRISTRYRQPLHLTYWQFYWRQGQIISRHTKILFQPNVRSWPIMGAVDGVIKRFLEKLIRWTGALLMWTQKAKALIQSYQSIWMITITISWQNFCHSQKPCRNTYENLWNLTINNEAAKAAIYLSRYLESTVYFQRDYTLSYLVRCPFNLHIYTTKLL